MAHDGAGPGPLAEAVAGIDRWARPRLLRYFMAGGLARSEAEDLVQQTMLLVLRGLGQLREPEKLLPWLFAIARRVRARARRRQHVERARHGEADLDSLKEAGPGMEARSGLRRRLRRLDPAIAALPRQQRQCLLLQVREELSYAEIADALCLSRNTVRNHLAQARRALKLALDGGTDLVPQAPGPHLPHRSRPMLPEGGCDAQACA
jgi:RNA polymerase sigma-70 factor, ECF subfamily